MHRLGKTMWVLWVIGFFALITVAPWWVVTRIVRGGNRRTLSTAASNLAQQSIADLRIQYKDLNGRVTERNIHLRSVVKKDGVLWMHSHCDLRGETRSFLGSRVIQCVDLNTGELISDVVAFFDQMHDQSISDRS